MKTKIKLNDYEKEILELQKQYDKIEKQNKKIWSKYFWKIFGDVIIPMDIEDQRTDDVAFAVDYYFSKRKIYAVGLWENSIGAYCTNRLRNDEKIIEEINGTNDPENYVGVIKFTEKGKKYLRCKNENIFSSSNH